MEKNIYYFTFIMEKHILFYIYNGKYIYVLFYIYNGKIYIYYFIFIMEYIYIYYFILNSIIL